MLVLLNDLSSVLLYITGDPTVLKLYPLAVSLKGARAGNADRQVSRWYGRQISPPFLYLPFHLIPSHSVLCYCLARFFQPFPTMYWLSCPLLKAAVSQLENQGLVTQWERKLQVMWLNVYSYTVDVRDTSIITKNIVDLPFPAVALALMKMITANMFKQASPELLMEMKMAHDRYAEERWGMLSVRNVSVSPSQFQEPSCWLIHQMVHSSSPAHNPRNAIDHFYTWLVASAWPIWSHTTLG